MLTEVCAEIRNYFLRRYDDIHVGTFTVSDGEIEALPFLQNGQYFRIVGSVFNDGVWQYGEADERLHDETFSGSVWAMAVPPAVIALDSEITAWVAENEDAINNPYQSESFGGYSYQKTSGYAGESKDGGDGVSWQKQFAKRLSPYRRISVL